MLANQGSGLQSKIDMFSFGTFSDITNLRSRQNCVELRSVRIFVKVWFEMFYPFSSFKTCPIQRGCAHLEGKTIMATDVTVIFPRQQKVMEKY